MLLQNAAFLPMFREAMQGRGGVKDLTVDALDEGDFAHGTLDVAEILDELGRDPLSAARQTQALLSQGDAESAERLMDAARLLVFFKGDDAHDYKFSSAILEDYYHVSPEWRNTYLASNVFKLPSAGAPDNPLVERARAALNA